MNKYLWLGKDFDDTFCLLLMSLTAIEAVNEIRRLTQFDLTSAYQIYKKIKEDYSEQR